VDNETSSIIEETKKSQIRRKPASSSSYMPNSTVDTYQQLQETELNACGDIRCHMIISQMTNMIL
jgi:hypothetical protein